MTNIDEMSLEEVDATMAKLRERKRELKSSNKVVERKITTLARRRERYLDKVRVIDSQIEDLRRNMTVTTTAPKRRGRRPKSASI